MENNRTESHPSRVAELRKGTVDLFILTMAASDSIYGQGLLEDPRTSAFMRSGSVYPALARLEKAGALASDWVRPSETRKRRVYAITETGRRILAELAAEWSRLDNLLKGLASEGAHHA